MIFFLVIISGGTYYLNNNINEPEEVGITEDNVNKNNDDSVNTQKDDSDIVEQPINTSTCSADEIQCDKGTFALRTESGCVCVNPDAGRWANESGINISLPKGSNLITDNYSELRFTLGQNYWEYLGNEGIVTVRLDVSKGLENYNDTQGHRCSIKNFSNKNEVDSKVSVSVDGQDFIKASGSDYGMSQSHIVDRYVQEIANSQCRVVMLSINSSNPDVHNYEQEVKEKIKENNKVFTEILEKEKEKILGNIVVGDPSY